VHRPDRRQAAKLRERDAEVQRVVASIVEQEAAAETGGGVRGAPRRADSAHADEVADVELAHNRTSSGSRVQSGETSTTAAPDSMGGRDGGGVRQDLPIVKWEFGISFP
jgi:hypothetical protein